MRCLAAVSLLALTSCAALPGNTEIVGACQFFYSVKSASAVTSVVDPVCKLAMAGQPTPSGRDAAWVRGETVRLEELELTAHHRLAAE